MDEVVEVFWDMWRVGSTNLRDFEPLMRDHKVKSTSKEAPWVRAWAELFVMWCRAEGHKPVALVNAHDEFRGELVETSMYPHIVSRGTSMANSCVRIGKDNYEVYPDDRIVGCGLVGCPQGAAFVWCRDISYEVSWMRNADLASTLWGSPGDRGRFYNMTGGKKIENRFFETLPRVGRDVKASIYRILGGGERD